MPAQRDSIPATAPSERSPQNLLAAASWALFVAVIFGGYSLLRLLTMQDALSPFEEQFFRAGHAHAGVLTAVGVLYSSSLARTGLPRRTQIRAWLAYLVSVLMVSGGFFLHMLVGKEGEGSVGTILIAAGAVALGSCMLVLAWHLWRARDVDPA
ncbi:MAG: hypothetical protein WBA46_07495 [Thermomicrobiales bacterium]